MVLYRFFCFFSLFSLFLASFLRFLFHSSYLTRTFSVERISYDTWQPVTPRTLVLPERANPPFYSEDYYGDLDLKSIRKSELHLGLPKSQGGASSKDNSNTPPPVKSTSKPRPSSSSQQQSRSQQQNTLPAQRPSQKDAVYDDDSAWGPWCKYTAANRVLL